MSSNFRLFRWIRIVNRKYQSTTYGICSVKQKRQDNSSPFSVLKVILYAAESPLGLVPYSKSLYIPILEMKQSTINFPL